MERPTSEKVWAKVFADFDVTKVWGNLNVKYNCIECEHNDFIIRHNRIFTNVVLHQIDNNISRLCDVCKGTDENFNHYFAECPMLVGLFAKIKELLSKHCGVKVESTVEWKKLLLFGVLGKVKGVNVNLVNSVLSQVRYAIVFRRNMAHYEGRTIPVWEWFVSMFKKNVRLVYMLKREDFHNCFLKNSSLIMVTGAGSLGFNL